MNQPLSAIGYGGLEPSVIPVSFPANVFAHIGNWAQQRPLVPALVHKEHGSWGLYRWDDVARELAHLRVALIREKVGPLSRFVVSGAFEPKLILLALAAHSAGATVFTINRHSREDNLQALLQAAAPTHAFVQDRQTISLWLDSGHVNSAQVPLYSTQSVRRGSASWQIRPLADLLGSRQEFAGINKCKRLAALAGLWVEEGSEWDDGLSAVLEAWLTSGATLIAPETTASAGRDRQETTFQNVVVSPARSQQWRNELDARRSAPGSWARRVLDWAGRHPENRLAAMIRDRVQGLHGLPDAAYQQRGESV